ncbi:hypothetical protein [Hyphomonas sp.]|uniref:hypothetical protein n=1 Tax=Hyphomonas sp. TaxID=87 RepID=UPI0039197C3A
MRCRLAPALCAILFPALVPAAALAEQAPRSAAIDQVQQGARTSDRSRAALDQIGPAERRGAVDQIDPAARARDPAAGAAFLTAAPRPARAARGCQVTPEQAAIIDSLRAQGRILADDCDLVDWVAVTHGRTPSEERRDRAERAEAALPGQISIAADHEREQERERDEAQRIEAARQNFFLEALMPPGR